MPDSRCLPRPKPTGRRADLAIPVPASPSQAHSHDHPLCRTRPCSLQPRSAVHEPTWVRLINLTSVKARGKVDLLAPVETVWFQGVWGDNIDNDGDDDEDEDGGLPQGCSEPPSQRRTSLCVRSSGIEGRAMSGSLKHLEWRSKACLTGCRGRTARLQEARLMPRLTHNGPRSGGSRDHVPSPWSPWATVSAAGATGALSSRPGVTWLVDVGTGPPAPFFPYWAMGRLPWAPQDPICFPASVRLCPQEARLSRGSAQACRPAKAALGCSAALLGSWLTRPHPKRQVGCPSPSWQTEKIPTQILLRRAHSRTLQLKLCLWVSQPPPHVRPAPPDTTFQAFHRGLGWGQGTCSHAHTLMLPHVYTRAPTSIHKHVHTGIHTAMRTCVHTHQHARRHIHPHMHTAVWTLAHTPPCTRVCKHSCAHMCTHLHTHVHTAMCTGRNDPGCSLCHHSSHVPL